MRPLPNPLARRLSPSLLLAGLVWAGCGGGGTPSTTGTAAGGGGSTASSTSSSSASSSSTSSSTGGGGAPACTAGEVAPCYTGPAGTANKGLCKPGAHTCHADGSGFGPCTGEVLPAPESCAAPGDENCDGHIDEGCACTPGAMRACYGADPATEGVGPCQAGTQVCDAGGQGWGDCAGAVTPQPETCGDGVDDDCDGQVDQGCVCTPNAVGPCYDGAASTQGVGACQAGTRACNALGTGFVGSCAGQVLPAPSEDCATPVDDDCNGVVNEGCACVPGATQPCYSGPMGTLGVGVCHGGTQTCKANGQWGACAGEVTPANEVCGGGDENCDGQVDEGCTCTPGATASCYDGPAGTAGVGLCHAGTKTCAASGLAWDACAGEVTPSFEVCTNGLDDNCDGHVDECWTPVASLPAPRNWHAGALGPDGRIYVMGGEGNLGAIQASTFAYTVATNTWASVAPMGTPREKLGAATGADGRVYAVGGMTDAATWVATVEAYTPATNTWSAVASMSVKRREHAVVAGADGTIYAIGGRNSAGALATVEAYTPATNTWAPRASMPAAHYKVTAALGADGRIYAMGDASSSTAVLAYDPAADTWSPVAGYVQARKDAQAARASDGRIYAIGGYTNVELSIAEAYDPATNTWHAVAPMIDRRTLFAAVAGPDGRVYAIGGWQDVLQGGLTQVEAYKP